MNHTSRRILGALAISSLLVSLTGCGTEERAADDPGGTSEGTTTTVNEEYRYPTGAEDVVLDVFTGGGYTPIEYQFALQPRIRVMGDGTVLLAEPATFGDASLNGVQVVHASESDLQHLLGLADDADLLGPAPDYEMADGVMVTDLPTTTVTLANPDETYTHSAYALGFGEGATPARDALSGFIDDAVALFADAPAQPYVPAELELNINPQSEGEDGVAWPGEPLRRGATCQVVEATPEIVDLLASSGPRTRFVSEGSSFAVTGAMVLPGDEACEDWE